MFAIAVAATTNASTPAIIALLIFLAATTSLLAGIAAMVRDVGVSQRAVQFEARRVLGLGK